MKASPIEAMIAAILLAAAESGSSPQIGQNKNRRKCPAPNTTNQPYQDSIWDEVEIRLDQAYANCSEEDKISFLDHVRNWIEGKSIQNYPTATGPGRATSNAAGSQAAEHQGHWIPGSSSGEFKAATHGVPDSSVFPVRGYSMEQARQLGLVP